MPTCILHSICKAHYLIEAKTPNDEKQAPPSMPVMTEYAKNSWGGAEKAPDWLEF